MLLDGQVDGSIVWYRYILISILNDLRLPDCRHTFTSLWKGQKLDEAFRRKIQGHSGHGIGEKVYMLPDIEDLRDELDLLWVPDAVGCMLAISPTPGSQSGAETA